MKILILKKDSKKGFSFLDGINRPVIPSQVTKLAKSLIKMGCIRPVVVAKILFLNEKEQYIIDGQHLFNALLRNNMDIPYTEIPIKDKRELVENIALLNASSKSWSMTDYVTAWGSINPEYKQLKSLNGIYDMEMGVIAAVMMGMSPVSNGTISRRIKLGEFSISDSEFKLILDYLTDVLHILPRIDRKQDRYASSEYIQFLKWAGKNYNHAKFISLLQKNKSQFRLSIQEEGRLVEIFRKMN